MMRQYVDRYKTGRRMKYILLLTLGLFLLSVDCGEVLCPNLQLETQAGRSFDTNISIFNCSSMCDGVVCVTNVSGVDNYTISINDCLTIGVQGVAYPGEREVYFQYEFTCNFIDPPIIQSAEASLLLRGIEMEIVLRNHGNGLFIDSGSTVELSCFSHLNDSGDIPFSFNLVSVTANLTASCDVSTNHEMRCVSPVEDRDWEICRNKTEPHNCVLYLHNFDDYGDGNYSCSTEIAGNRVWSNVLELHAWKNLEPSPNGPGSSSSGLNKLELGIGVGIAVFMVVLVVLFIILSALKSRRRASNDHYQRLQNQDQHSDGVYTPGTGSPNLQDSAVNVGDDSGPAQDVERYVSLAPTPSDGSRNRHSPSASD